MNMIQQVVLASGVMPHGMCYLWQPQVLGLHVISDMCSFSHYDC